MVPLDPFAARQTVTLALWVTRDGLRVREGIDWKLMGSEKFTHSMDELWEPVRNKWGVAMTWCSPK